MAGFQKTGPANTHRWIASDSTGNTAVADPLEDLDNIIKGVNKLRTASSNELLPSTALLLVEMFPIEAANNHLDVHILPNWKANFKNSMNREGLRAALNKMDFEVSKHLDSLMSLFQTSGGIIDYNNFIQCCALVEKHLKKPPNSSSASKTAKPSWGSTVAAKPGQPGGSSGGPNMNASGSANG